MKHETLKRIAWSIGAAMVVAGSQAEAAQVASPLNSSDRWFVSDFLKNNQEQIDLSTYAERHARSDQVRQFAERVVREHKLLASEMQGINDGLIPSATEGTQSDPNLSSLKGPNFDRRYMNEMANDLDIAAGDCAVAVGGTPYSASVQTVAMKALPTLRAENTRADTLDQSLPSNG